MSKFLRWLPRILSIALILFISLFAFDVFSAHSGWDVLLPLLMHLMPSLFLVAVTVVAWKRERIGGTTFLVVGVLMLAFTNFEALVISLPVIVLGVLFLIAARTGTVNRKAVTTPQSTP
jgi:hypothetical protein